MLAKKRWEKNHDSRIRAKLPGVDSQSLFEKYGEGIKKFVNMVQRTTQRATLWRIEGGVGCAPPPRRRPRNDGIFVKTSQ
eukprot:5703699-Pleurochrysis_carterae.AAC.1